MELSQIGFLVLRVVLGLTMLGHGTMKLFGWFGGYGIKGTGGWLESIGLKPGVLMAVLAGLCESASGLGLAAGFLTPLSAAVMILVMLVAIVTVDGKNGYWITAKGAEYNVLIIAVALAFALAGPGPVSVDALLFPR